MRRLTLALALVAAMPSGADLSWRAVWEWSLPKRTDADLVRLVESAHALGFNALLMSVPAGKEQFVSDECHRRGMRLYLSTVFAGGDPAWQQVMTPAQEARLDLPLPVNYQHGGEPLAADEVLNSPLPCWSRQEVRAFFAHKVRRLAALPADGLALDYIGYRNYGRCHCPACDAALREARRHDPAVTVSRWAEDVLVNFVNEMADVARTARPGISLTIHVYPVFMPNPYYGHRLNLDYTGETVSWFFHPHWPLPKVQLRSMQIVRRQGTVWPGQTSAPFIGFDARQLRDYRSASRVAKELDAVQQSGASALQLAELGYLLDKPLVAQAVAEKLGGSYRARWRQLAGG